MTVPAQSAQVQTHAGRVPTTSESNTRKTTPSNGRTLTTAMCTLRSYGVKFTMKGWCTG